jgi:RsiW-degrading membrane proteinase PrsW (M82 family)
MSSIAYYLCYSVATATEREELPTAIRIFFFSGLVGLIVVVIFQAIATWAYNDQSKFIPGRPSSIFYLMLKAIGAGYHELELEQRGGSDASSPEFYKTTLSFAGAGACEELTKLLPILFLFMKGRMKSQRSILFFGAFSGLGFGIAEGVYYSMGLYRHIHAPASVYIARFLGIAFLHSTWTLIATKGLISHGDEIQELRRRSREPKKDRDDSPGTELVFCIILIAVPSTLLHCLHNSFLIFEASFYGLVVDTLAIIIGIVIVASHQELAPNHPGIIRRKIRQP